MNQMKNRLQGLTLLDRAFTAMSDDELEALVASLPDDHRTALDEICGAREGGFSEPASSTSPRDHLQPANGLYFRLKLMVKRRHKPIPDPEISTLDHHPAS